VTLKINKSPRTRTGNFFPLPEMPVTRICSCSTRMANSAPAARQRIEDGETYNVPRFASFLAAYGPTHSPISEAVLTCNCSQAHDESTMLSASTILSSRKFMAATTAQMRALVSEMPQWNNPA